MLTKRKTRKAERRLADDLGGSAVAASGAMLGNPGDVRAGRFLIDLKQTEKGSYSLKAATLKKIHSEAMLSGREPALLIQFMADATEWAVIPRRVFEDALKT